MEHLNEWDWKAHILEIERISGEKVEPWIMELIENLITHTEERAALNALDILDIMHAKELKEAEKKGRDAAVEIIKEKAMKVMTQDNEITGYAIDLEDLEAARTQKEV